MDPNDSFSPPLDGLHCGRKRHNILTTLNDADCVEYTHSIPEENREGGSIVAIVSLEDIVEIEGDGEPIGLLRSNWWHMRYDPDWWEYEYIEVDRQEVLDAAEALDEDSDEGVPIDILHTCGWYRKENNHVDDLTYFGIVTKAGWEYEPFQTAMETPRGLTKAIIDTHLPENIRSRY